MHSFANEKMIQSPRGKEFNVSVLNFGSFLASRE
jgi:hypothetical protein